MAKEIADLLYEFNTRADITIESLADLISDIAVPVVRCKDCKHSFGELATRGGVWDTDAKHLFCNMTKRLMSVDDFCSWGERGERREDEAD